MLVLGIDTSDKNINLALWENEQVISVIKESNQISENLVNFIHDLLTNVGKEPEDLDVIGVITGPGGYTGTRTGLAVAKTMGQLLEIPLLGFSKTEALLASYPVKNILLTPLIDIRRQEVFTCIGKIDNELKFFYESEEKAENLRDWLDYLRTKSFPLTILASEFSDKKDLLENLPENISVDFDYVLTPENIARFTSEYFQSGKKSTYEEILPLYAREAI